MKDKIILIDAGSELFVKTVKECLREVLKEFSPNSSGSLVASKEVMPIADAAKFLGLAKQTVYALVSKRKLPHYKRGKRLYFRRAELEQWITDGKKPTEEELRNQWR